MKKAKIAPRMWFNLITFGLMGQIAWNVENMYFNTFLYNSVYNGADQAAINGSMNVISAINVMVALSAATAVVTTFIMGTLSDRINRRKIFICFGYIAWGLVTASFGLISRDNIAALTGLTDTTRILTATIWTVIIMDCVMTLMGSTSNDSAFNAWVTDVTDKSNRPLVESVFAVLPIAAMGVVVGLGALVATIGYPKFFIALGALVTVCGVVGLLTIKETRSGIKEKKSNYWAELVYGFRPGVIKENIRLYLAFSAICVFGVAVQIFFPYLLIYLEHVIIPATGEILSARFIVCAVISVAIMGAALLTILKLADKIGRERVFLIASVSFVAGLFLLWFAKELSLFVLFAAPAVVGYALLLILLNASIRDLTPQDKVGQFQGVRMIFFVLIPMILGPTIGNIATQNSAVAYINEYGVETIVPTSLMFLCASAVSILVFVPVVALNKLRLSKTNEEKAAVSG